MQVPIIWIYRQHGIYWHDHSYACLHFSRTVGVQFRFHILHKHEPRCHRPHRHKAPTSYGSGRCFILDLSPVCIILIRRLGHTSILVIRRLRISHLGQGVIGVWFRERICTMGQWINIGVMAASRVGSGPLSVFGHGLLKAQFVVFDAGNLQIGFAAKKT